jgi:hypothetical protein
VQPSYFEHLCITKQTKQKLTLMKTINRLQESAIKVLIVLLVVSFNLVQSCTVQAQSINERTRQSAHRSEVNRNKYYRGIGVSFGSRSFKSVSMYSAIDKKIVSVQGGQLNVTLGNEHLRTDIGLIGYYSSSASVAGSIDYYTNHISTKFYPSYLFTNSHPRFEPYFTTGIAYYRYKFYGHYAAEDVNKINYSAPAPYLGTVRQMAAAIGVGLEFKIIDKHNFVHLFTEVKWSKSLASGSTTFDNTHLSGNTIVNIGLAFGHLRNAR